jgi:hypothetical protein
MHVCMQLVRLGYELTIFRKHDSFESVGLRVRMFELVEVATRGSSDRSWSCSSLKCAVRLDYIGMATAVSCQHSSFSCSRSKYRISPLNLAKGLLHSGTTRSCFHSNSQVSVCLLAPKQLFKFGCCITVPCLSGT